MESWTSHDIPKKIIQKSRFFIYENIQKSMENSPKNMDSTMEQKGERTTTAALSGDEPLAYGACSRGSERGAVIRTWGFTMI
jgi:hypothetical protein